LKRIRSRLHSTQIDRAPLTPILRPERCTHQSIDLVDVYSVRSVRTGARTPPPTLLSLIFTCQRAKPASCETARNPGPPGPAHRRPDPEAPPAAGPSGPAPPMTPVYAPVRSLSTAPPRKSELSCETIAVPHSKGKAIPCADIG
jgi:hypothetical protein